MKKIILASFILLGFVKVNAQTVTLNVKLKPIQTLVVNPSQKEVNLEYITEADYTNGVASVNADHLTIYSTGGFQVKVKSADATMINGTKNIQVNTIKVIPTAGSNKMDNALYGTGINLSNTETTLVTSTTGGVNKKINIEYKGAGADAYINNYIAGQNPTVYTTTLTYTIVSQ
jgi:hypothetical protein